MAVRSVDDLVRRASPGRTLVVGSRVYGGKVDRRTLYAQALGLDMQPGEGVDVVHDLELPLIDQFDHIDCCSVLEHVRRPWLMAENILGVMKPGATILITVPFVWRLHDYPGDFWRMTPEALPILFPGVLWHFRALLVNDKFVDRCPTVQGDGIPWFARCETVAFGERTR